MTENAAPTAAFELSPDLDLRTFGGTVADRQGRMIDLAARLDEGNGRIEESDEFLITTFDSHPALVRIEMEVKPGDVHHSQLNREQLNEYSESIGIEDPKSYRTKPELLAAVDEQLAADEAGEEVSDAGEETLGGDNNSDPQEG